MFASIGMIEADLDRPYETADFVLDFAASFLQIVLIGSDLVVTRLYSGTPTILPRQLERVLG